MIDNNLFNSSARNDIQPEQSRIVAYLSKSVNEAERFVIFKAPRQFIP